VPATRWGILAIFLGGAAGPAHSQSEEGIPSVVVLAEKREKRLEDVPIAVSALSSGELRAAGITDADGVAAELPTLDMQRNASLATASLRIRRIGNIGNIPTFEPAVGVFVDGAYRSRSFLGTTNFLAVDHVEVLRGPQTALHGKNVSAGLLSLYTRRPGNEWSLQTELTRGWIDAPARANAQSLMFDVSGPFSETLAGGLAGRVARHDHTLRNVLPGGPDGDNKREGGVRAQLSWSPDESLELRLLAGYTRSHGDEGESDVFFAEDAPSTQVASLLQRLDLAPECPDNVPRNRKVCSVATNRLEFDAGDLTLLGQYSLPGGLRLASTAAWDTYRIVRYEDDAIQLFTPMLFFTDPERGRSLQQELRLESADDGPFTWLGGVFYYRNEYERGARGRLPMFGPNGEVAFDPVWPVILGGIALALPGQDGLHDSQLRTRYRSVFAQASWQLTPRFGIGGSVRWQEEDKRAAIDNRVTSPGLSLISAVLTPASTLEGQPVNGTLRRSMSNVPWSLTPQYRFNDNGLLYLTAARGSRSGGFNTGFGDAPLEAREFADESIRHYELGTKVALANRRVRINAAAFYGKHRNYQDAAFISAQFSVGNAERVETKGVEVETSALLGDRLTLNFSVSKVDLRYVSYTRGLCYPGRVPDGSAPGTCDLSNERPIQAPEWETQLSLAYQRPTRWGALSGRLAWSWTDEYHTSFSADPRLRQPAYHDLSSRIGLQFGKDWELVFWGRNLLDETVAPFDLLLNLFNDASYQSYLAAPRSYGMSLRLTF
jgi:iron complex outermembrane receptor protein